MPVGGVVSVCLFGWGRGSWQLHRGWTARFSLWLFSWFIFYKENKNWSLSSFLSFFSQNTTTPGWGILFNFCFSPSAVHVEEHPLFLEVKCSLLLLSMFSSNSFDLCSFVDACGWCQSSQDLVQFGNKVSTNSTNVVETDTFHDSGILFIESIWR